LYLVCLVTVLAGLCVGSRSAARARGSVELRHVTLILDFLPNAGHIGIFHALRAGYYAQAGIDLSVIQPTSTSDTLKLIATGKADSGSPTVSTWPPRSTWAATRRRSWRWFSGRW